MRRIHIWATAALLMLFLYYEVYRWIPLSRWNWQFSWSVKNDQFYPDIVIGFLLLWIARSFSRLHRVWIPYTKNAPENLGRFSFYSQRTQIPPVIGGHPPDAGHAILDFLVFPTFVLALTATITNLRADRPSVNAL